MPDLSPLPLVAANHCKCEHGTPGEGETCPVDGESKCVACDHGYDLQMDDTCVGSFVLYLYFIFRDVFYLFLGMLVGMYVGPLMHDKGCV